MANPQAEKGHVDIANEIVEYLATYNLSSYEWRTLWALWRKTWGWHKTWDRISISQFQKMTGLKRRHQYRALKALISKNVVTNRGNGRIKEYKFQKDYLQWKIVTSAGNIKRSVTYRGNTPLPKEVTQSLPIEVPTKENKETIQKKEEDSLFIYSYYEEKITGGGREEAIKGISSLLEEGKTSEELIARIDSYRRQLSRDGIESRFYIRPNNFFGESARWKDYEPKDRKIRDADPSCESCKGTGWVFSENGAKRCSCMLIKATS
ncbi:MAG: replication protein [Deltaproteobacteria bacterium]|nr:replication protein [Deltaproteobacteria bacterium]